MLVSILNFSNKQITKQYNFISKILHFLFLSGPETSFRMRINMFLIPLRYIKSSSVDFSCVIFPPPSVMI